MADLPIDDHRPGKEPGWCCVPVPPAPGSRTCSMPGGQASGRSDGLGCIWRGGDSGAKPTLALISVPQQGRRLDTTPL